MLNRRKKKYRITYLKHRTIPRRGSVEQINSPCEEEVKEHAAAGGNNLLIIPYKSR